MESAWLSPHKACGFSVQPEKEVTGACFPLSFLLHLFLSLPILVTNISLTNLGSICLAPYYLVVPDLGGV